MASINKQRVMARIEGDFVVFLIGMRINRFWKIHKWLPVALAMSSMLKELRGKPESGFLGSQDGFGVSIQYWRSFEHLEAFAKNKDGLHYPAWRSFNLKMKNNGDVGIWHETYKIASGNYETLYNNMPPHGLGKIAPFVPAIGKYESAAGRMQNKEV